MTRKALFFVFLLSIISISVAVFGFGNLALGQEGGVSGFSNTGTTADLCFKYYPFGRINIGVDTDKGTYLPGEKAFISGNISNGHFLPVSDISVLAHLFKQEDKNGGMPEFLMDQKIIGQKLNIAAGETLPIKLEYKLPAWLPDGKYTLSFYLIEAEQFNISGLPFIPNVSGNNETFFVKSGKSFNIPFFEIEKATISGEKYSRNIPSVPISGKSASVFVPLYNPSDFAQEITVKKKLYHWDNSFEANFIQEEKQTVSLSSKERQEVGFVSPEMDPGVYMIVLEASVGDGSKTLIRLRFSVSGNRPRLVWSGLSKYPVPPGEKADIITCYANEVQANSEESNNLNVSIGSPGGEAVDDLPGQVVPVTPSVGAVVQQVDFKNGAERNIILDAKVYDKEGNLLDSVSKNYLKKISAAPAWAWAVFGLLATGILLFLARLHKRKGSLTVLIFGFLITLSFAYLASGVKSAEAAAYGSSRDFGLVLFMEDLDNAKDTTYARISYRLSAAIDLTSVSATTGETFAETDIKTEFGEWYVTGGGFDSPPFIFKNGSQMYYTDTFKNYFNDLSKAGGDLTIMPTNNQDKNFKVKSVEKNNNGSVKEKSCLQLNVFDGGKKIKISTDSRQFVEDPDKDCDYSTRVKWAQSDIKNKNLNVNNVMETISCDYSDKYQDKKKGTGNWVDTGGSGSAFDYSAGNFTVKASAAGAYDLKLIRTFSQCDIKLTLEYDNGGQMAVLNPTQSIIQTRESDYTQGGDLKFGDTASFSPFNLEDTSTVSVVAPKTYPLTVNKTGQGTGTVDLEATTTKGDIFEKQIDFNLSGNDSDDAGSYEFDTKVNLKAIPDSGFAATWTGGCSSVSNNGRDCSVTMDAAKSATVSFAPIIASCVAVPNKAALHQDVLWTATQSGGYGPWTYDWQGDAAPDTSSNFDDPASVRRQYLETGLKKGSVRIKDVNSVATTSPVCSAEIVIMAVSCAANLNSVTVNSPTTFTATVSGGAAPYTYLWSGDDGLSGTAQTVTKSYTTTGTKNATITVKDRSGNEQATNTCSVGVTNTPPPPPPPDCTTTGTCPPPPDCTTTGTCPPPPDCTTTGTCPTTNYILTINILGSGSGTVSDSGGNELCFGSGGTPCLISYAEETSLNLSASAYPDNGSNFIGWSGGDNCSGLDGCSVTMNGPKTVNATFNINNNDCPNCGCPTCDSSSSSSESVTPSSSSSSESANSSSSSSFSPVSGGPISVTSDPETILATIVEGLPANSSKATLSVAVNPPFEENVSVSFIASGLPSGTAVFLPPSVTFSAGATSANEAVKFYVKNILGNTTARQYKINITANYTTADGPFVATKEINLNVEKINTTWREI